MALSQEDVIGDQSPRPTTKAIFLDAIVQAASFGFVLGVVTGVVQKAWRLGRWVTRSS